jgi:hypothetical protein
VKLRWQAYGKNLREAEMHAAGQNGTRSKLPRLNDLAIAGNNGAQPNARYHSDA